MTTAAAAAVEGSAPATDGRIPRRPPAICYVRSTSIRDIQSLATNVRNPPQPCGASIDRHSYVV
jgi:hypothetical protein